MGVDFGWNKTWLEWDILDIIRLEVIRVSCWWWLYQYGWCRTKEGALDWTPFFYIKCTIPVPELNFQCLWSAWKWHFKDDYWQLITALRYAKTPLLHGVSLLIGGNAWESNPPLSLTRDISFEGCGAHQGHIRFQTFGKPNRIILHSEKTELRMICSNLD